MAKPYYSKSYKSNKNTFYEIEDHPFEILVKPQTRYLVIGTFPTYKDNYQFNYYYSGEKNLFWNILEKVFNHNFHFSSGKEAVEERKSFLEQRNIGITDMVAKCYRKNRWSGDENIYPIILQNIFKLLREGTSIERLILTSRTEVIGTLGLLKTYFMQNGLALPAPVRRIDNLKEIHITYDTRPFEIFVPFSPSSRHIDTPQKFNEAVGMYRECFNLHR